MQKLIQKQLNTYTNKLLSLLLYGYRKVYSTLFALMTLIEKWEVSPDQKGIDISESLDTINHQLLTAKLRAYGFSNDSLEMTLSYLPNHYQPVKVNTRLSSWTGLIQAVPHGTVLEPILFNI